MPAGTQYLALLRGINVGGRNIVRMADLREAFGELGLADVATYIASGNVLFRAPGQARARLAAEVERALSRRFGADLKVVLVPETQLEDVVEAAPEGFGAESHRSDVIFLRAPLTVKRAFPLFETKEGVDRVWPGNGVVYFTRLASRASSSRLSRIVARPEYQEMTIRSWSTTTKLLTLMRSRR